MPNRLSGYRAFDDDAGDHGSGNRIQQSEEFLQLIQPRIGDVNDVLVVDGESLGEKIAVGVAEIETVDDGRTAAGSGRQGSCLEGADDIRRLEPKKKDPLGICAQVLQPSGLG